MGTVARMDGLERVGALRLRPLEDCGALLEQPEQLRLRAARDGFVYLGRLVPADLVRRLRHRVLEHAHRSGWLDPSAPVSEARAQAGRRVGHYQDPDWIDLQVQVNQAPEMWALGMAAEIHRALGAADGRSPSLTLSTANGCRVISPHPELATPPHQDAHFVHYIEDFWTAWIPLEDCPLELGPIALLAGSHLGGLAPHAAGTIGERCTGVPDDAVWSTTNFQCGDVVLFRPHTLHCSLENRSGDRLRLSADFRYGFWNGTAAVDWRAAAVER